MISVLIHAMKPLQTMSYSPEDKPTIMKRIQLREFNVHCLDPIEDVRITRVPVVITKRCKPVARLVPVGKPPKFIGRLEGIFKVVGNIESPVDPLEAWESSM
jgi:prevent-host-death family protein